MHHFLGEVIRNINKRQRALRVFVKTEFFDIEQLPLGNSRHVYPEERGIRKHIYDAKPKLRMPKVGQVFSINTKLWIFPCVCCCVCVMRVFVCVCVGCSCFLLLLLFFWGGRLNFHYSQFWEILLTLLKTNLPGPKISSRWISSRGEWENFLILELCW